RSRDRVGARIGGDGQLVGAPARCRRPPGNARGIREPARCRAQGGVARGLGAGGDRVGPGRADRRAPPGGSHRGGGALTRAGSTLRGVMLAGVVATAHAQPTRPAGEVAAAPSREAAMERPRVLLMPEHETTLVAQTVGRIARLGGGLGEAFRAGATLVAFDCAEQEARLKIGRAELDSARRNLEAKERLEALKAAGEIEVQIARAAVDRAAAQVELANVQIAQ